MKMPLTHADLLLTIAKGDKGDPCPMSPIVNRWIRTA